MSSLMGIIFALGDSGNMLELTKKRSSSAIPVGGKYRAVDFPLSNMVNSGIVNIGILTQYNYRSLMDHLGSGKEWDLDRKNDGLFIFPPYMNYVFLKGKANSCENCYFRDIPWTKIEVI